MDGKKGCFLDGWLSCCFFEWWRGERSYDASGDEAGAPFWLSVLHQLSSRQWMWVCLVGVGEARLALAYFFDFEIDYGFRTLELTIAVNCRASYRTTSNGE